MEVRPATPPVAPPAAGPVFCKDCAHFNGAPALRFAQCMAPDAQIINLVYGYESVACEKARSDRIYGSCGPSGKLFAKASPDLIASVANSVSDTV